MNRNPKYETLTLKLAQYKTTFKKLPSGKGKSSYFVTIWYKPKQKSVEDYKNTEYTEQVFFRKYNDWIETFPYSFDTNGIWSCLEEYKKGTLNGQCNEETDN